MKGRANSQKSSRLWLCLHSRSAEPHGRRFMFATNKNTLTSADAAIWQATTPGSGLSLRSKRRESPAYTWRSNQHTFCSWQANSTGLHQENPNFNGTKEYYHSGARRTPVAGCSRDCIGWHGSAYHSRSQHVVTSLMQDFISTSSRLTTAFLPEYGSRQAISPCRA